MLLAKIKPWMKKKENRMNEYFVVYDEVQKSLNACKYYGILNNINKQIMLDKVTNYIIKLSHGSDKEDILDDVNTIVNGIMYEVTEYAPIDIWGQIQSKLKVMHII